VAPRGAGTEIRVSADAAAYAATASIPNPESMGPGYRRAVAGELSVYATQSRPLLLQARLAHALPGGERVVLGLTHARTRPVEPGVPGSSAAGIPTPRAGVILPYP
jgi:hypothetical protein